MKYFSFRHHELESFGRPMPTVVRETMVAFHLALSRMNSPLKCIVVQLVWHITSFLCLEVRAGCGQSLVDFFSNSLLFKSALISLPVSSMILLSLLLLIISTLSLKLYGRPLRVLPYANERTPKKNRGLSAARSFVGGKEA